MARATASAVVLACAVLAAVPARCQRLPCPDGSDGARIGEAIARIRASVDPCGESAEVARILRRVARCAYVVCTSGAADRNLFDRGTVTWNPGLRSELHPDAIVRGPVASLLHELVHVADHCDGRNPGALELEAVRIENIYRRAAGLPQRTRYGELPLPPSMTRECRPGRCSCSTAGGTGARPSVPPAPPAGPQAADSAPTDVDAGSAR